MLNIKGAEFLIPKRLPSDIKDIDVIEINQPTQNQDIKPKKRRQLHNREELHERIIKVINDYKKLHPPPLRLVAKKVGVSTDCIRYQFPAIVKKIVENHKQWQQEDQRKKRQEAQVAAFKFFNDIF